MVESRDCRSRWNERTVGVGVLEKIVVVPKGMLDIEDFKELLIKIMSKV